jgi:hypothetical protein
MDNLYKLGLYKYLKGKRKTWALNDMYAHIISLTAANQFDYNTPDYNKYQYETSIMTGVAAFYRCPVKNSVNYNKWCCTPAYPADVPDNMHVASKITTHGSDYALELTPGVDCELIYNNSALYPECIIGRFADMFAECDKSTDALVRWSRMTPIPIVNDDVDIAKYTAVMQRIIDGEEINAISDNSRLIRDGHNSIDDNLLRLTDESAIEKMHFFSEYHDMLIKRICTYGGIPFSQSAKSAQSLEDELHDMDVFSTFYIIDRYNNRQEGFKRCESLMKKNGVEFSFNFDYSKYQKLILDRIKAEEKQPEAELEQTETETEKADETTDEKEEVKDGDENADI